QFLPGLSLLPLPLDGGFLIVLSPFHLLEQASLQHELLQRLERLLDLIVAHIDFHESNSLLERECVRRSEGDLTEPVSDGRKVRWLSIEIASTEETDGSLRPTISRKREAEGFFALVGDLHPLFLRVSVESHPARVVGGVDQVCLLGRPSPRGSGRTAPSPAAARVTPCRARVSQSRPRSFSVQPWARRGATQALTMAAETTGSSGFTSMRSGQRLSMTGTAGRGAGGEVILCVPSSAARSSGSGGSSVGAWAVRPGHR